MNEPSFPEWHFGIGDPSPVGWLTVAAYFLTALLTLIVAIRANAIFSSIETRKQKAFWLAMTFAMFCLGINKQLDLQSYLTAITKYFAHKNNWYDERRTMQMLFIKGVALASCCLLILLIYQFRNTLQQNGLAILGLCVLAAFIAIRASSFHHMDDLINSNFFNLRLNWIIELSGIMMIAVSALLNLWAYRGIQTEYPKPAKH